MKVIKAKGKKRPGAVVRLKQKFPGRNTVSGHSTAELTGARIIARLVE